MYTELAKLISCGPKEEVSIQPLFVAGIAAATSANNLVQNATSVTLTVTNQQATLVIPFNTDGWSVVEGLCFNGRITSDTSVGDAQAEMSQIKCRVRDVGTGRCFTQATVNPNNSGTDDFVNATCFTQRDIYSGVAIRPEWFVKPLWLKKGSSLEVTVAPIDTLDANTRTVAIRVFAIGHVRISK